MTLSATVVSRPLRLSQGVPLSPPIYVGSRLECGDRGVLDPKIFVKGTMFVVQSGDSLPPSTS